MTLIFAPYIFPACHVRTQRCRAARSCVTFFKRRFSSDIAAKEAAAASSAALLQGQPLSDSVADPNSTPTRKSAAFLKYGLLSTVVGAGAAAGYVTYEYTTEELDEKTKPLRDSANFGFGNTASPFEKFQALVYWAPLAVPSKAVELYLDIRRAIETHIREYTEPSSEKLLPDLRPMEKHLFTLVLDLNETLIHSDWKRDRGWQTFKRPGVDAFLEQLAQFYEIIVYSDQQNMILLLKGSIKKAQFAINSQEMPLNIKMENIIGIYRS
uniref:Mitochondrial import inner membrane translocase subunit TIM50 n=1 Tax=Kalanchoe fedtschenkoi TaxID=63787 RepID=A0A7N0VL25_KALFE